MTTLIGQASTPFNLRWLEPGAVVPVDIQTLSAFAAELRRLHAENEALRADAERYRYLRNRKTNDVLDNIGLAAGVWIDCEDKNGKLVLLTGADADEAIDAARERP